MFGEIWIKYFHSQKKKNQKWINFFFTVAARWKEAFAMDVQWNGILSSDVNGK